MHVPRDALADVTTAAIIESTNPDTAPYVTAYLRGAAPLHARPGSPAPVPVFTAPDKLQPSGDPRWQALRGEREPAAGRSG